MGNDNTPGLFDKCKDLHPTIIRELNNKENKIKSDFSFESISNQISSEDSLNSKKDYCELSKIFPNLPDCKYYIEVMNIGGLLDSSLGRLTHIFQLFALIQSLKDKKNLPELLKSLKSIDYQRVQELTNNAFKEEDIKSAYSAYHLLIEDDEDILLPVLGYATGGAISALASSLLGGGMTVCFPIGILAVGIICFIGLPYILRKRKINPEKTKEKILKNFELLIKKISDQLMDASFLFKKNSHLKEKKTVERKSSSNSFKELSSIKAINEYDKRKVNTNFFRFNNVFILAIDKQPVFDYERNNTMNNSLSSSQFNKDPSINNSFNDPSLYLFEGCYFTGTYIKDFPNSKRLESHDNDIESLKEITEYKSYYLSRIESLLEMITYNSKHFENLFQLEEELSTDSSSDSEIDKEILKEKIEKIITPCVKKISDTSVKIAKEENLPIEEVSINIPKEKKETKIPIVPPVIIPKEEDINIALDKNSIYEQIKKDFSGQFNIFEKNSVGIYGISARHLTNDKTLLYKWGDETKYKEFQIERKKSNRLIKADYAEDGGIFYYEKGRKISYRKWNEENKENKINN